MGQFSNYSEYVSKEAKSLVSEYLTDLIEEVKGGSVYLDDYFNDIVHSWIDSDFIYTDLHDCADILDSSANVESDSGLWEGQEPIEAVKTMAFFTYRADLMEAVVENAKWELDDRLKNEEQELKDLQEDLVDREEKIATADEQYNEFVDEEDREQELADLEAELETLNLQAETISEEIGDKEQFIEYLEETLNRN